MIDCILILDQKGTPQFFQCTTTFPLSSLTDLQVSLLKHIKVKKKSELLQQNTMFCNQGRYQLVYQQQGDVIIAVCGSNTPNPFSLSSLIRSISKFFLQTTNPIKLSLLKQKYSQISLGLENILYNDLQFDFLSIENSLLNLQQERHTPRTKKKSKPKKPKKTKKKSLKKKKPKTKTHKRRKTFKLIKKNPLKSLSNEKTEEPRDRKNLQINQNTETIQNKAKTSFIKIYAKHNNQAFNVSKSYKIYRSLISKPFLAHQPKEKIKFSPNFYVHPKTIPNTRKIQIQNNQEFDINDHFLSSQLSMLKTFQCPERNESQDDENVKEKNNNKKRNNEMVFKSKQLTPDNNKKNNNNSEECISSTESQQQRPSQNENENENENENTIRPINEKENKNEYNAISKQFNSDTLNQEYKEISNQIINSKNLNSQLYYKNPNQNEKGNEQKNNDRVKEEVSKRNILQTTNITQNNNNESYLKIIKKNPKFFEITFQIAEINTSLIFEQSILLQQKIQNTQKTLRDKNSNIDQLFTQKYENNGIENKNNENTNNNLNENGNENINEHTYKKNENTYTNVNNEFYNEKEKEKEKDKDKEKEKEKEKEKGEREGKDTDTENMEDDDTYENNVKNDNQKNIIKNKKNENNDGDENTNQKNENQYENDTELYNINNEIDLNNQNELNNENNKNNQNEKNIDQDITKIENDNNNETETENENMDVNENLEEIKNMHEKGNHVNYREEENETQINTLKSQNKYENNVENDNDKNIIKNNKKENTDGDESIKKNEKNEHQNENDNELDNINNQNNLNNQNELNNENNKNNQNEKNIDQNITKIENDNNNETETENKNVNNENMEANENLEEIKNMHEKGNHVNYREEENETHINTLKSQNKYENNVKNDNDKNIIKNNENGDTDGGEKEKDRKNSKNNENIIQKKDQIKDAMGNGNEHIPQKNEYVDVCSGEYQNANVPLNVAIKTKYSVKIDNREIIYLDYQYNKLKNCRIIGHLYFQIINNNNTNLGLKSPQNLFFNIHNTEKINKVAHDPRIVEKTETDNRYKFLNIKNCILPKNILKYQINKNFTFQPIKIDYKCISKNNIYLISIGYRINPLFVNKIKNIHFILYLDCAVKRIATKPKAKLNLHHTKSKNILWEITNYNSSKLETKFETNQMLNEIIIGIQYQIPDFSLSNINIEIDNLSKKFFQTSQLIKTMSNRYIIHIPINNK
ncbi:recq-mediated genome instability protein [Anaeramoeba flamelloides]|uniref:Recq-mediated genome instability protein n=1 Tax=Anaeramoeba flamelloides TaxID=1746091 RepID=A0ABQ8X9I5_9EUKA|nr:recq-mediated genome instability protein [Anaeramoeba flamelloides]